MGTYAAATWTKKETTTDTANQNVQGVEAQNAYSGLKSGGNISITDGGAFEFAGEAFGNMLDVVSESLGNADQAQARVLESVQTAVNPSGKTDKTLIYAIAAVAAVALIWGMK